MYDESVYAYVTFTFIYIHITLGKSCFFFLFFFLTFSQNPTIIFYILVVTIKIILIFSMFYISSNGLFQITNGKGSLLSGSDSELSFIGE